MIIRCAVCGGGAMGTLHRISDNYGKPGIWTCDAHGPQAINNLARAQGVEAVLPKFRRYIERSLRVVGDE